MSEEAIRRSLPVRQRIDGRGVGLRRTLPVLDPAVAIASPALFAHYVSRGTYQLARHVNLLDDLLLDVAGGGVFAVVEIHPRAGKSTLVSGALPPWYLGTFPDRRVALISYETDFAQSWGRRARDTFIEYGHLFPGSPRASRSSAARGRWNIEGHPEAGMFATGIGGAITGRGANLIVVDDYVKNAEQARSATYRNRTWDWWQSTMRTRLEPGGSIIVMATRWHEDDLIGRLLLEDGTTDDGGLWRRLRIPAIAEEGGPDPLGRAPGEAMWPERWPLQALRELERRVGPYWFAALYQQTPRVEGGGIFKRAHFRYYRSSGTGSSRPILNLDGRLFDQSRYRVFATIDVADSTSTSADYTVIAVWAYTNDGDLVLLARYRERMEGPNVLKLTTMAHQRWGCILGVESKVYGTALIRDLQRRGIPVQPLKADTDKVTRALWAAAMYEGGRVWHPHPDDEAWVGQPAPHGWEAELLGFPHGTNDDQVDTVAYAARVVAAWGRAIDHGDGPVDEVSARVNDLSYDLADRL